MSSSVTRIVTGPVVWVWIIVCWGAILVDLWEEGEIARFKHLFRKLVGPG